MDKKIIENVTKEICDVSKNLSYCIKLKKQKKILPSRSSIINIVENLRGVLFPRYFGEDNFSSSGLEFHIGSLLDKVSLQIKEQINRGLCFECQDICEYNKCEDKAHHLALEFISRLPEIQKLLTTDVQAAYKGDPAAKSPDETIFCYPGILCITNHRISHELFKLEIPLIPRIISEYAHNITGIDIHPGANIGKEFFIDHGTGVVIGETAVIGNSVRIYQGVTLGAKSFPLGIDGKPIKGVLRHPIIEDNVIIYAGATILGRITIGKASVIGGNAWITDDVPPNSKIR